MTSKCIRALLNHGAEINAKNKVKYSYWWCLSSENYCLMAVVIPANHHFNVIYTHASTAVLMSLMTYKVIHLIERMDSAAFRKWSWGLISYGVSPRLWRWYTCYWRGRILTWMMGLSIRFTNILPFLLISIKSVNIAVLMLGRILRASSSDSSQMRLINS